MRQLFILLLVPIIFGCNTGSSIAPKYEINTPDHWVRTDSLTKKGFLSIKLESPLDSLTNVKAFIGTSMIESQDANTSLNRNIEAIKHYAQNFEEIGRGEKKINRITSNWVRYYVSYKEVPAPLELESVFIPKSGYVIIVNCLAAKGRLNQFLNVFDTALASLKFSN